MHQLYSSSLMPFQANTDTPRAAIAAAAWSWVEKILQDDQFTSAPSSSNVSISTDVWIVICRQPAIRAPRSGWLGQYCFRIAIIPENGRTSCRERWGQYG